MKKTGLLLVFLVVFLRGNTQTWVQVPDPNFQSFLSSYYPNAVTTMGGNFYIDQSNPDVIATTIINLPLANIADISGIEVFVNLTNLNCGPNQLTTLPALPSGLTHLYCASNQLTSLPTLPSGLTYLNCANNQLTILPALPSGLTTLYCKDNQLTSLPALPSGLTNLECYDNQLTSLPVLPSGLTNLNCTNNQLTTLPVLPSGLSSLACDNNQITTWPVLPSGLTNFSCTNNQLTALPTLPSGLVVLNCSFNQLTSLPALPSGLTGLHCNFNQLTALPTLPSGLTNLGCSDNQLTFLPALPSGLNRLACFNNQITCFYGFPQSLNDPLFFYISNNSFTCLPNYVAAMDLETLAYPLCEEIDPVNNPNACSAASGITGVVFNDVNNNCVNSGINVPHVPIQLSDNASNPLQSGSSFVNGSYMFTPGPGNYKIKVDDANLPIGVEVVCPLTNEHVITNSSGVSSGKNFGLQCTGFDLGVQSVFTQGWVFPGQTHVATIEAGDLSAYFGLNCANGIAGDVTVSVSGPGTVLSFGDSTSSVSGNSAVYSVTDFGGFLSDFTTQIQTDTTAQAGDQFCITVTISTSTTGDLDTTNNTYEFCYNVINSYDPNIKQTTPELVAPGYEDEFTYTIYFQNTGSAPAFNIRLEDVLDNNLNLATFRVVKASHDYNVNVNRTTRKLVVRYPNIMLPDSTSDAEGSIGFVQYRIKPLTGLQVGTVIENTAAIYFDYNEPIITNTTQNAVDPVLGIKNTTVQTVSLFPNPANDKITIRSSECMENIEIYSVNGRLYHSMVSADKEVTLSLTELPEGIYIAKVLSKNGVSTARFIKK